MLSPGARLKVLCTHSPVQPQISHLELLLHTLLKSGQLRSCQGLTTSSEPWRQERCAALPVEVRDVTCGLSDLQVGTGKLEHPAAKVQITQTSSSATLLPAHACRHLQKENLVRGRGHKFMLISYSACRIGACVSFSPLLEKLHVMTPFQALHVERPWLHAAFTLACFVFICYYMVVVAASNFEERCPPGESREAQEVAKEKLCVKAGSCGTWNLASRKVFAMRGNS